MKLLIILGIAVAVTATLPLDSPQAIRLGSVGMTVVDIKGCLASRGDASSAVPLYEFKSSEPGALVGEKEFYSFRCNVITEFYQPDSPNPVLVCRNQNLNKETQQLSKGWAFLFTHSGLTLAPQVRAVDLVIGKSTVSNFLSSYASAVPGSHEKMGRGYGGSKFLGGRASPFQTLLGYNH